MHGAVVIDSRKTRRSLFNFEEFSIYLKFGGFLKKDELESRVAFAL